MPPPNQWRIHSKGDDRRGGFAHRQGGWAAKAVPGGSNDLMDQARKQVASGRYQDAYTTLRQCEQLAPGRPDVLEAMADLLHRQGEFGRALGLYQRILRRKPRRVSALTHGGILLMKMGHIEDGRNWLRRAAALRGSPEILYNLAMAERAHGDFPAALEILEKLHVVQPDHHLGLLGKAQILERMGKAEAAYSILETLVQQDRPLVGGLCAFARLAPKFGAAEEARDRVQGYLPHVASDTHAKQLLLFALGGVEDSLGNFDDAFRAYELGNQLSHKVYQPEKVESAAADITRFFSADRLAKARKAKNGSPSPVLIIGMPRSGTSLVEQILDSHPMVAGAGELNYLHGAVESLSGSLDYPAGLDGIAEGDLEDLASGYRETLSRVAGKDCKIVTDKMPTNFEHLGLAALLAPQARAVHCMRDPRDVCLSAFFQNFRSGNSFANDLTNLGHFHRYYERLMAHWHAVAPMPIVDVSYESLVTKPEETIRRLLDELDLPFDEACLQPDRNRRYVNTASVDQVRGPIHSGSVGRWRRYASHLSPLEDALAVEA